MMMMMVFLFSLAPILAQWIASMAKLWSIRWASPMPSIFMSLARLDDSKTMSLTCGEWRGRGGGGGV